MCKRKDPLDFASSLAPSWRAGRRARWRLLVQAFTVALLITLLPPVASPFLMRLLSTNNGVPESLVRTTANVAAPFMASSAAALSTNPGGVSTNLAWWYQGDVGVQHTGAAVTGWNDMLGALNITQATAANQPTYTKYQNFNPVVTFDGTNDFLRNTAGYWKSSTNNQQYTFFAVANAKAAGANSLFGENMSAGVQMVWAPNGNNVYHGLYPTYVSTVGWGGVAGHTESMDGAVQQQQCPQGQRHCARCQATAE